MDNLKLYQSDNNKAILYNLVKKHYKQKYNQTIGNEYFTVLLQEMNSTLNSLPQRHPNMKPNDYLKQLSILTLNKTITSINKFKSTSNNNRVNYNSPNVLNNKKDGELRYQESQYNRNYNSSYKPPLPNLTSQYQINNSDINSKFDNASHLRDLQNSYYNDIKQQPPPNIPHQLIPQKTQYEPLVPQMNQQQQQQQQFEPSLISSSDLEHFNNINNFTSQQPAIQQQPPSQPIQQQQIQFPNESQYNQQYTTQIQKFQNQANNFHQQQSNLNNVNEIEYTLVNISSKDREISKFKKPNNYTIPFNYQGLLGVEIVNMEIPKSGYLINKYNDILYFKETDNEELSIVIPHGDYTEMELGSIINNLFNSNSKANSKYSIEVDKISKKLLFNSKPPSGAAVHQFTILFEKTPMLANILGFDNINLNKSLKYKAHRRMNISGINNIFLQLPEISDKNISNVIFDTNIRDNIKYHKNETGLERVLYDNYKSITNLTIRFVTNENNDYDFEGIDHSITLKVKLVKMFQPGIHTNNLMN